MRLRSISSGLLLSAVVAISCPLFAQETQTAPAAPAAAAPAPAKAVDPKLVQQADDFLHFSLINNIELAKANGEALLASNASDEDLLRAFEGARHCFFNLISAASAWACRPSP